MKNKIKNNKKEHKDSDSSFEINSDVDSIGVLDQPACAY